MTEPLTTEPTATTEPGLRAAVLGSGAWGTTFAMVLADAGCDVTIWGRSQQVCDQIVSEHRNSRNLPGIRLPESILATTDAAAALDGAELVVIAIPSQSARETLTALRADVPDGAVVVSLMKGVELETDRRMSEVVSEALGIEAARVVVVSGPNLAREIAERQPTATVVAGTDAAATSLCSNVPLTGSTASPRRPIGAAIPCAGPNSRTRWAASSQQWANVTANPS